MDVGARNESNAVSASPPLVLICILNYRTAERTLVAVERALSSDYPNFRILLIENGSGDNSAEVLGRLQHPKLDLVVSEWNTGFCGGCNLAFDRAVETGAKYTFLLNNDALMEADALSKLVRVVEEDPTVGLVCPLVGSDRGDGELEYAGAYFDEWGEHKTEDVEEGQRWMQEKANCFVTYGTALIVRTELAQKIGGLDESFFMYWDDVDLSMQSIAAGYRNVVTPEVVVQHHEKNLGELLGRVKPYYLYYVNRNLIKLRRKYGGLYKRRGPIWWWIRRSLKLRRRMGECTEHGDAIAIGILHGFLGTTGQCPDRFRAGWALRLATNAVSRKTLGPAETMDQLRGE